MAPAQRYVFWSLIAAPMATLVVSYAYLALYHGELNLLNIIVHESGHLTLLETAFYWDHFLGMLPHLAILTGVLVSAFLFYAPPRRPTDDRQRWKTRALTAGLCCIAFVTLAFFVSVHSVGLEATMAYLLQDKERVTLITPGGNWRMTLTANLGNAIGLFLAVLVFRVLIAREVPRAQVGWSWPLATAASLFALISIVKGVGVDSFTNPRWLAHNVREFATFPLLVLPWAFATAWLCEGSSSSGPEERPIPLPRIVVWQLVLLAGLVLAVTALHVAVVTSHDIGEMAQKPAFAHGGRLSVPYLLAFHYFEHVLDLFFVVPLTVFTFSTARLLQPHEGCRVERRI